MRTRRIQLAVTMIGLALISACGEAGSTTAAGNETPGTEQTESVQGDPKRFDKLTIELELAAPTVTAGGKVEGFLNIRNDSDEPVTDPSCHLGGVIYALLPIDDPDGELWEAIVVDCGGPKVMPPGFVDRYSGYTFQASTKYGEPLPPGDYIATMEIRGLSERLTAPIEVTE